MAAKCSCGFASAVTFAVIGLLVLIAGVATPFIVRMIMDDAVKKTIIINFEDQSEETVAKYIDTDLNYKFYLFNITNLPLALSGSEKIRVEEVGPYNYIKYQHKYNITFSEDGNTVTHFTWTKWIAQDSGSLNPLTDQIVTVNPVYPNAIGQAASNFGCVSGGVYYPCDDAIEERLLMLFTVSAMKEFQQVFTNETGPLLPALRVGSIASLIQFMSGFITTQITQFGNADFFAVFPNAQAVLAHIVDPRKDSTTCGTLAPFFAYNPTTEQCNFVAHNGFDDCTGQIELPYNISLEADDIGTLFTPNGPFAIVSINGLLNWAQAAPGFVFGGNIVPPTFEAAFGADDAATVMSAVAPWILQWLNPANDVAYRGCVTGILRITGNHNGLPQGATWSQFGVYQYITGNLTKAFLGAPSIQALGSLLPSPLPAAPEAGVFVNPYTGAPLDLSYENATFMFNTFTSDLTLGLWYFQGIGFCTGSVELPCTGDCVNRCLGMKAYARFVGIRFALNSLIGANWGLFMKRTPNDILFGYNDPFLANAGRPPRVPGFFGPNITSQDLDWINNHGAGNVSRGASPDTEYTGQVDFDKLGQYQYYEGARIVDSINDFPRVAFGSGGAFACKPFDGSSLEALSRVRIGYAGDCSLWVEPEVIDGQHTPYQFKPFDEGSGVDQYSLWVKEVRRAVILVKAEDVTFKGIKMRRYILESSQLKNSSVTPARANYFQNLGDGIFPMNRFQGFDLFISQPHFLGADVESVRARLHPTSTIDPDGSYDGHQTYLLVEPYSGKTMSARKRLQLGFMIHTQRFLNATFETTPYSPLTSQYQYNNPLLLPILWAEEGKDIGDEDAEKFVKNIYDNRKTMDTILIAGAAGGGALFAIMTALSCRLSRKNTGAQSKSTGRLSEDYMGGTTI